MYSEPDSPDSSSAVNYQRDFKYILPTKNVYKPISQVDSYTLQHLFKIVDIDPKSQYSLARAFEELVLSNYEQLTDDPEHFYKTLQGFKEAAVIKVHFRDITRSKVQEQGISEEISLKLIPKSYIPPKYSLSHQIVKDEKSNPSKKIRKTDRHNNGLDVTSPNGFPSTPNTVASKSTYASVAVSSAPVHSFKITKNTKTHTYKPFFTNATTSTPLVELEYPNGFQETFSLVVPYSRKEASIDTEEYSPVQDIINTIEVIAAYCCDEEVGSQYGDQRVGLIRNLIKSRNTSDQQLFMETLQQINQITRKVREEGQFLTHPSALNHHISSHLLHQAYSRAVAPHSDLLVENRAFASTTYGEINPIFVNEIIEKTELTDNMIFIDLGSGIGNVVLQVAAQVGCETHGVEIVPIAHSLARLNRQELHHRYELYNATPPTTWLHQGDLSTDPNIKSKIAQADVVLANNYLFDSRLDNKLSELLMNMKNYAKVISLKPLVPLDFKVNKRNLGELSAIMKCEKLGYAKDFVSWTNSPGDYYLQTIDRNPLEEYLMNQ